MTFIATHNFCHRLTAAGIVESTEVEIQGDRLAFNEHGWTHRLPQTMDLTGGDITQIQDMLVRLTQLFPRDGGQRLPHSTKDAKQTLDATSVM